MKSLFLGCYDDANTDIGTLPRTLLMPYLGVVIKEVWLYMSIKGAREPPTQGWSEGYDRDVSKITFFLPNPSPQFEMPHFTL